MNHHLNDLVVTKKNLLGVCFYDTYGNRTATLTINNKQFFKIQKILNQ